MSTSSLPIISDDPAVQAFYEQMRLNGETHALAEMCAMRRGPSLETDSTFLAGHCNGNQFAGRRTAESRGNVLKKIAKQHGQDVTGKVYLSQLARFPGDPEAWVSGRGDVKRVCAERNWGCEGSVNHQMNRDNDNGMQYNVNGVAEDILDNEVATILEETPEVAPTPKERIELKEKLRERRRPPKVV